MAICIYFSTEKKSKCALHVRFFNDNGQRSWVNHLIFYFGLMNADQNYPDYVVSIYSKTSISFSLDMNLIA